MMDEILSSSVSRVRQPIESLFSWIDEKTGIQTASKVRSTQGLLVHVYGKLAAALLLLTPIFNSYRSYAVGKKQLTWQDE